MAQEHNIEKIVENVLHAWNENCRHNGMDKTYVISTNFRDKTYRIATEDNKVHEGKVAIGELCLFEHSGSITKLIYRTETPYDNPLPKGYKGSEYAWKQLNAAKTKTFLYNSFLYECIGTFAATSVKFFDDKQLAEYDLDLDRIKGDVGYNGIWIVVDQAPEGSWYKVGDKYEVFTQTQSNNWGVYSYRQDHKNGIGQIPLIHAKLVKEEKENKEGSLDKLKPELDKLVEKEVKPKAKTNARKNKTTKS